MSHRQHIFGAEGLEAEPRELTENDREIMRRWMTITGQCLWCLRTGSLWSFATFIKKTKGRTVSLNMCKCPECGNKSKRNTLIKIHNMTMKDFAETFWDRAFGGEFEKVWWMPFTDRLKQFFDYSQRQVFWDVYHEHKALSLGGWDTDEDDDAYEDYLAHAEEGEPQ